MILKFLAGAVLVVFVQPSHATDAICGFLDKVVASAREKPPFASVKYLNIPGAKCQVADYKRHLTMGIASPQLPRLERNHWACVWQDHQLRNVNQDWNFRGPTRLRMLREEFENYSERSSDYYEAKARYDKYRVERKKLLEARQRLRGILLSRVGKFVSSVQ